MNRGKPILSWSEPDPWRRAALDHAREEGQSTFPWATWIGVLALVGGVITWGWSNADPSKRVGVPALVGIILALFGFFVAIGWIHVRLNRRTTTTLYEGGLLHGSLSHRRWTPWSGIESFDLDEDWIGQQKFRFLTWTRKGSGEEEFSVLADDVDVDRVAGIFRDHQVQQDPAARQQDDG